MKPRKSKALRTVQGKVRTQDFQAGLVQGKDVALHTIGPEIWGKAFRRGALVGAVIGGAVGAAAGYVLGLWA